MFLHIYSTLFTLELIIHKYEVEKRNETDGYHLSSQILRFMAYFDLAGFKALIDGFQFTDTKRMRPDITKVNGGKLTEKTVR